MKSEQAAEGVAVFVGRSFVSDLQSQENLSESLEVKQRARKRHKFSSTQPFLICFVSGLLGILCFSLSFLRLSQLVLVLGWYLCVVCLCLTLCCVCLIPEIHRKVCVDYRPIALRKRFHTPNHTNTYTQHIHSHPLSFSHTPSPSHTPTFRQAEKFGKHFFFPHNRCTHVLYMHLTSGLIK